MLPGTANKNIKGTVTCPLVGKTAVIVKIIFLIKSQIWPLRDFHPLFLSLNSIVTWNRFHSDFHKSILQSEIFQIGLYSHQHPQTSLCPLHPTNNLHLKSYIHSSLFFSKILKPYDCNF